MKSKLDIVLRLWEGLCSCVAVGYFIFSAAIGGSALNGYCEAGNYYVGEHGSYVSVTEQIWNISYIWNVGFFLVIPLAPLGMFLITAIGKKMQGRNG